MFPFVVTQVRDVFSNGVLLSRLESNEEQCLEGSMELRDQKLDKRQYILKLGYLGKSI